MPTKRFPYDSFYAVPVYSVGKGLLASDDSEPGIILVVAGKKDLEVLVRDVFCLDYTVKTVCAQQSVRRSDSVRFDSIGRVLI